MKYAGACSCLLLALFLILLSAVAPSPSFGSGMSFHQTDAYALPSDQSEQKELWLMADSIDVQGRMEASLFALGTAAELGGLFDRDVWVAAQTIRLEGELRGHGRFAAQNSVMIKAPIQGNLMAVAFQTIAIEADTAIGQDAVLAADHVIVQGHIRGNAVIWARRAILNGPIDGHLRIKADEITFLQEARIGGDLVYQAPRELTLGPHTVIGGEMRRLPLPPPLFGQRAQWGMQLYLYLGALLTGIVFAACFPRYTRRAAVIIRRDFWQSALVGSLAFFLLPAAAFIAVLTVVGLPAGVLLAAAYAALLYLSKIVVGLALGSLLLQRPPPSSFAMLSWIMAVGLLLLYFAAGLPIVGSVVTITILFIGLGGLILALRHVQYKQNTPPDLPDTEWVRVEDTLSEKT